MAVAPSPSSLSLAPSSTHQLLLLSPSDLEALAATLSSAQKPGVELTLLIRHFFHQAASVESFMLKFQASTRAAMNAGAGNPLIVTQVFEMTQAVDSLYAFVLGVGEEWAVEVRDWLLLAFKKNLVYPIPHPEMLKVVVRCLAQLDLLYTSEAVGTVASLLDGLFEQDSDQCPPLHNTSTSSSTPSALSASSAAGAGGAEDGAAAAATADARLPPCVKRMTLALALVVGDLLPILPQQMNVLGMYQDRGIV